MDTNDWVIWFVACVGLVVLVGLLGKTLIFWLKHREPAPPPQ